MAKAGIMGAGSWGTALALLLYKMGMRLLCGQSTMTR